VGRKITPVFLIASCAGMSSAVNSGCRGVLDLAVEVVGCGKQIGLRLW
jgi:hypothetical protein